MSDLLSNDLQELLKTLKERTNYYQAEISKMEAIFLKLGLMDEHLKVIDESIESMDQLMELKTKFLEVKELSPNAMALSYADRLRKQNSYAAKMKICFKLYIELNESLTKKIKHLKSNYQQAQQEVDQISTITEDDLKTIEKKISRYEQELLRMEKKNPWLRNHDYNLSHIAKEISQLKASQLEKEDLVKKLSVYHGLKPDLVEANEQLAKIKLEHQEICDKLKYEFLN